MKVGAVQVNVDGAASAWMLGGKGSKRGAAGCLIERQIGNHGKRSEKMKKTKSNGNVNKTPGKKRNK